MGYRVAWIARRGDATAELLDALALEPAAGRSEFLDVGFYLLQLPDRGWSVLIADGSENYAELQAAHARTLSKGSETVFFWCSDTSMSTSMQGSRDGEQVWAIDYNCEDDSMRPAMHGHVPPEAKSLLETLRADQRAADDAGEHVDHIYDLTAALGLALVGFRHDENVDVDHPRPFIELQRQDLAIEARLQRALQALLARTNDDAFVILEDQASEKFVQFGTDATLVLDLPLVSLSDDERRRASAAFERLGVTAPDEYRGGDHVLRCDFGADHQRAAREALDLFNAVYQLPAPRLRLQEN